MSYLSGDAESMRKAEDYVRHILETQDRDGYIGVYSRELRFSENPGNGELWTQACVLRGLLAYYQFTGDRKVLEAVERAVGCTMNHYGPGRSAVFSMARPSWGGIGHSLMFADVLETLWDITGNSAYRDFGLWLYDDFNKIVVPADLSSSDDVTIALLRLLDKPWIGHGVHSYEHLRVPLWLYFVSGKPELEMAYRNGFIKAGRYLFPSGAPVSMEVMGRPPDPTQAYYEYCTMTGELATYTSGLQKTGRIDLGDIAEKVTFNAAEGARSAGGMSITYCTRDNRYQITGELGNRSKFSPANQPACCNPNYVRTLPLYVRAMWMKTPEGGLAATLYGPSEVNTVLGGTRVTIKEQTDYPFSSRVALLIEAERPIEFPLVLRNPGWSKETRVNAGGVQAVRDGDYFLICKRWEHGDRVTIEFKESIQGIAAVNGEMALQRGPLVSCLRIPETGRQVKTYDLAGFADMYYVPAPSAHWNYALASTGEDYGFKVVQGGPVGQYPFEGAPLGLSGRLINMDTGRLEAVSLIPMGSSLAVLRRETFPVQSSKKGGSF